MARSGDDDADDDLGLDGDDAYLEPTRRRSAARSAPRERPGPVRPWDAEFDESNPTEEWEEDPARPGRGWRRRTPVYWRARDSLYFEPLVALAIVVLLLVGLYTFTSNWPPAYVVESRSMQHGPEDHVGLINAGDLILAEKVPNATIVPYVVGYRTGVRTYGEFGDVILYHANGATSGTPIVHRSILFLVWDPATKEYSAPDLRGLACGNKSNLTAGELYYTTSVGGGCGTSGFTGAFYLYNVGWDGLTVEIDLDDFSAIGEHSGYLTLGDGNPVPDQYPVGGGGTTPTLSSLVEPGWVIGVARGMLPWFGALKLLLQGNAQNVSSDSWQFLGLAVIAAIGAAFGIHYALRQEGIESPMRRREEEAARSRARARDDEEDEETPPPRRFLGSIRPWHDDSDGDERTAAPAGSRRAPPSPPPTRERTDDPRGRPRPHVHRTPRKRRTDDKDETL